MQPFAQYRDAGLAKLLQTGQITQYGSGIGMDDGFYQKGRSKLYTILTLGQYSGTTNITINSKTDIHSNNCVVDNRTKLMWSRYTSASVGPTSNGLLPWTTTGSGGTAEGIFPYVLAANAAALGGYSDWRTPNITDLQSIADYEAPNGLPDAVAFPSFPTGNYHWSSTTQASIIVNSIAHYFYGCVETAISKTTNFFALLVRG